MFCHDDDKGHVIIGQAAISLAMSGQEISVQSLIRELSLMAETEQSDRKLEEIFDARRWLQSFSRFQSREQAEQHWMTLTGPDDDGKHD